MGLFGKSKKEKAAELMATGAKGIGTVVAVQDTGMTINDNPRVAMTFQVQPIDGSPAFQAQKTKTVSRVQIPRAGDRYPVWYDASDPSLWMYATVDNEEGVAQIRAMFGTAADALFGGATAPAPAAQASPEGNAMEALQQLAQMQQAGLITPEEFASKKAELLARM